MDPVLSFQSGGVVDDDRYSPSSSTGAFRRAGGGAFGGQGRCERSRKPKLAHISFGQDVQNWTGKRAEFSKPGEFDTSQEMRDYLTGMILSMLLLTTISTSAMRHIEWVAK